MSVEAIISLVLSALRALPGIVEALTPDQRAEVAAILEAARSRLPVAGSVTSATEAVIARHVAAAHFEPRVSDTLPPPMPIPPVLDAPRGTWDEPGHEED